MGKLIPRILCGPSSCRLPRRLSEPFWRFEDSSSSRFPMILVTKFLKPKIYEVEKSELTISTTPPFYKLNQIFARIRALNPKYNICAFNRQGFCGQLDLQKKIRDGFFWGPVTKVLPIARVLLFRKFSQESNRLPYPESKQW